MANAENYTDLTIRWNGHSKFRSNKIIENEPIEVIVQKLEMILFTNKKEILGQDGMRLGADLEYQLWETRIANDVIRGDVVSQINQWVPELNIIGYDLELKIFEGEYRDAMELNFTIKGYNIHFIFE